MTTAEPWVVTSLLSSVTSIYSGASVDPDGGPLVEAVLFFSYSMMQKGKLGGLMQVLF